MCECKVCGKKSNKDGTENWVQCDGCDLWYHFECVSVDESIQHRDWNCSLCIKGSNSVNVLYTPDHPMSQTPTATTSVHQEVPRGLVTPPEAHTIGDERRSEIMGLKVDERAPPQAVFNLSPTADETNRHHQLTLAMLEEKRAAEERYIEQKYRLLANMDSAGTSSFQIAPSGGPTRSQIAARQAMPKDLPPFSGDPEEWPMFVSTFDHSTSVAGFSNVENMLRLQRCLKGKAREIVKDKLLLPDMVPDVINILKTFFGRPEHILERTIERVRKLPPPKDKLETLIEFSLAVRNICATMETCKLEAHLNNPMLVKELVDKLPNQHKLSWAMHPRQGTSPTIKEFSDWLYRIAEAASTVISPAFYKTSSVNTHSHGECTASKVPTPRKQETPRRGDSSQMQARTPSSVDTQPKRTAMKCIACGAIEHCAAQCKQFHGLSGQERWETAKKGGACYRCLKPHRKGCFSKKSCGINGCPRKHHPLLHSEGTETPVEAEKDQAIVSTHRNNKTSSQYFRIMPVNLHTASKTIKVYAFLDEGSSVSLIDEATFKKLDIEGVPTPICLQWTSETTRNESASVRASMQISAPDTGRLYWLNNVHTIKNLALPKQTINADELRGKYPYLKDIPLQSYYDVQPTLLIGTDNWKIAVPRKIREGRRDEPIASKCLLGWGVQGTSTTSSHLTMHHCDCKWQDLHDIVKDSFSLDAVKTHNVQSVDDKKAIEILDRTCIKSNGQFEVGLLWRDNNDMLPESYTNATNRLNCLKAKIKREPGLYDKISEQIRNLLQKGYAVELSETEIAKQETRTWYLPIFIALNPNKPSKIRLVWDAAAKSHGVCLNDFLLTGPDLLNPLVEILMAFRIGQVAVCGDIAEMFHRINIRREDRHAQRFLWYNKASNDVNVYVMQAMTFGISCAPCIAHYIRNKNAESYRQQYPQAYEAIQNAHYVDDYIDSKDTEQEALEVATLVRKVHQAGGFEMRNWTSNSTKVLMQLLGADFTEQAPVQFGGPEKVLGMYWLPQTDAFKYVLRFARLRRDVLMNDLIPTKREVLQVLMSIFDPLGLLSCHTIGLKILLQNVWRVNIGWDEVLPESLYHRWRQWKQLLPEVEAIEIPRCYSPNLGKSTRVDLHTFVDASEHAYAAASYLRVHQYDNIDVTLVAAKSKVAPLKPLSIPRMELQAAVMGVRLTQKIINIRGLKIGIVTYWSDSKTVLHWLKMDPRNFQQFVMHRVGEILENSDNTQWRWVPTKLNVADGATKVNSTVGTKQWLQGPDFLKLQESEWPQQQQRLEETDTTELRKHLHVTRKNDAIKFNVEYFSEWRRLYRAVATFLLYLDRVNAKRLNQTKPSNITPELVDKAMNLLFKQAQAEAYSAEISSLRAKLPPSKQSRLAGLNVYLDDNEIMRTQGRAETINCRKDAIVMPKESYTTFLIVKAYHVENHHMSHETTINNIKASYHVPRLRVLYKHVRQSCHKCKINNVAPEPPQMAPIPAARLASFARPFTHTGVDYFGPMYANVGRRKEKRWGVLFTCLTLRAVHFEIAYSLDTSSCIMCLRNFMARRGTPTEIYSDNGTNFKATEKAVREELIKIDFDKITVKYDCIKWRFNPPAAPHMGGAWERLVRTTKTVLKGICPTYSFNDESLRSALMEAEYIINSRPLTFVSLESSDDVALTPNHLLLGSADGYKPVCSDDLDLRQRWHQTQLFGDRFWHRWVKEYAPVLTKRVKWFSKSTPIAVDDVVIVVDENLPRNLWPKGRVINTITAKDGQVRRVTIRTQRGVMERPATKVAKLDVGSDRGKQP